MYNLKGRLPVGIFLCTLVCLTALFALGGCTREADAADGQESRITVVATTTMLTDLAQQIGGDTVAANGLMGPGIDPHLYQASAGDVSKLQQADVVLYNGLHLEGKMGEIFASLHSQDKVVICIADGLDEKSLLYAQGDEAAYDPHIWFDAALWRAAAVHVTEALSQAYPENAALYAQNLDVYAGQLDELDAFVRDRAAEVPQNQRVLITAHDAFAYFGNAYGFDVKGLQGISTDAEAGTADVINLAQFIAENKIKAIFIESSVPPKTIEALQAAVAAKGFHVEIGGELYSDSLGDKESGTETYILTFQANVNTIVDALK